MLVATALIDPTAVISLAGISTIIGLIVAYSSHSKAKKAEGIKEGKFEQFVLGKLEDMIEAQKVAVEFDRSQVRINYEVELELARLRQEIKDYVRDHRRDGN